MTLREPLFFNPLLFERVWGGNRLGALLGKPLPQDKVIGESWELSDRPDAASTVASGALRGATLQQLLAQAPAELLGPALAARKPARFPLLVKYVDAGRPLSVQVHPDDAGARSYNDRGKTECWVVVHTEPEARIIRGFRPGVTRAEYEQAVADERVEDVLHFFEPKVGDVVALPAGMVHAIGAGLVVAEVQQNSDVTLRIYDYKRLGLDGKPRPLHVKEALGAIRFGDPGAEFDGDLRADRIVPLHVAAQPNGATIEQLLRGAYFDLQRWTLPPGAALDLPAQDACRVFMALNGSGWIAGHKLHAGQTGLLPAALPASTLAAGDDGLTLIFSTPTPAAC